MHKCSSGNVIVEEWQIYEAENCSFVFSSSKFRDRDIVCLRAATAFIALSERKSRRSTKSYDPANFC